MRELSLVDLALLGLSTWRLALLLVREYGPGDWSVKLRMRMGVRFDAHNQEIPDGSFLAGVFTCLWCMSVWIASCLSILYAFKRNVARLVCLPLAISGLAILMDGEKWRVRQP